MKKIIALSALVAAIASGNAMAADANLTFTGMVTSGTCVLNAADATKTVAMPSVTTAQVIAGGMYNFAKVDVPINFTNCPSAVTSISPRISTTGTIKGGAGQVSPEGGSGKGVLVGITNVDYLDGQSINSRLVGNVANGLATVPVQFYLGSDGLPTAGDYNTTYTMTWDWS